MNKVKYEHIKWLTKSEWSEDVRQAFGDVQPVGFAYGYYTPSYANWSYTVMITVINGRFYEVVTRFGSVEGGHEIDFDRFNQWNTEKLSK